MAKRGRPASILTITVQERAELLAHLATHKGPADEKLRIRIILGCADGEPGPSLAHRLKTTNQTVSKWRRRYRAYRFAGLSDAPRAGRRRTVQEEHVQAIVDKVRHDTPKDAAHWSVRAMAKETGVSAPTVQRIWHAFGLKPHLRESLKPSANPHDLDKVSDIVGLYMAPPDRTLAFCMDKESHTYAHNRTQPRLPLTFGEPAARMHEYNYCDNNSLLAALDIATGKIIGQLKQRHRSAEFLQFLNAIYGSVPADQDIHLIMDNYGIHRTETVRAWLTAHTRCHAHFTPTPASWLNLVGCLFSQTNEDRAKRNSNTNVTDLEQSIRSYVEQHNINTKPFVWHKSADAILASVTRTAAEFS